MAARCGELLFQVGDIPRGGVTERLAVKSPAASGGAFEGSYLLGWGNLSPKPPNKDTIPPHRKQWGILV